MADPASLIASWLTPSCLFIFVNLVIGTIAITSRFGSTPKNQEPQQQQLLRSPSLLQRVRSFNLTPPQTQHVQPEPEPEPELVRTPSLLERVTSFNLSFHKQEPTTNAETETEAERVELVRSPSVLQRIKSMNLSRLYRSESMPREDPDSAGKVEMRKSASERGVSTEREWGETVAFDEEVDTKADDFINMFRKQLRLQRIDSLLRCRHTQRTT